MPRYLVASAPSTVVKRIAALASIRSLCRLRLPAEQFIPALLDALHRVIASARNLFDFTDAHGNLIRYYFEGPIDHETTRHYFEQFHNRREAEVMPSFRQAVTGRSVILSAEAINNPQFFRSALYNEVWRPQGLHSRIEAIVRHDTERPLGSLVLYRGKDDRPFTRNDEALLASLVPYVARALTLEAVAPTGWADCASGHAGVVLSARGELLQASDHALRVLLLADGAITPEAAGRAPRREDFTSLSRLWQKVQADVGAPLHPASLVVENAWGRFVFDAQPLLPIVNRAASSASVHVSIRQQQVAAVALRRALDSIALSPAQREVAALLYAGRKQAEIAMTLQVAASTIADHVKKIYANVDVHSAHEFRVRIDALLGRQ
jgi:DNA-binding CsgD family transcriptional regulator